MSPARRTAICPRCGLTDLSPDLANPGQGSADPESAEPIAATAAWTVEFLRRCEHVHERRHLGDLRSHTCPHWARAMRDAAESAVEEQGRR
jgi:hypothetical protein